MFYIIRVINVFKYVLVLIYSDHTLILNILGIM